MVLFWAWKRIEIAHSISICLVGLSIFFTPLLAQIWFLYFETLLSLEETNYVTFLKPFTPLSLLSLRLSFSSLCLYFSSIFFKSAWIFQSFCWYSSKLLRNFPNLLRNSHANSTQIQQDLSCAMIDCNTPKFLSFGKLF